MRQEEQVISFRNVLGNAALFPVITLFPSNVQPLLLTATQVSIFGLEGVSGGNKEGNSSWHSAPIGGLKSSCDPLS